MNDHALAARIEINPELLASKAVIRGTRLAVEFVLSLLEGGWSFKEILDSYLGITEEDIRACIASSRLP